MTNYFEILQENINYLRDNMTLKDNYDDELERISGYENTLDVMRFYGNTRWKINDMRKQLNDIKAWIKEEMQYK